MEDFQTTYFIIAGIIAFVGAIIFIIVISLFISKKFRTKIISQQFDVVSSATLKSKESIKQASEALADATSGAVKKTAKAAKEGFAEDTMFCKHCGSKIDSDSKYCKHCGKMQ